MGGSIGSQAYDIVILGGGSAAFAAAIRASELGKTAALIERGTIGGTCVNVGCVPSKHLLVTGEFYRQAQRNPFRGLKCEGEVLDFSKVIEQKNEVVSGLRRRKYIDVLEELDGVDHLQGSGAFLSDHEVKVDGRRVNGSAFLIATGSSPWAPPIRGLREAGYWTNVEGLSPGGQPESLLVIGGRALGLEFAQMYAAFGTEVTLLQRSERIIPEEELECSEALRVALEEEGVGILTGTQPKEVHKKNGRKVVVANVAGVTKHLEAEEILVATGRRPNTAELGLDRAGVKLGGRGEVKVSREMRTNVSHIYAAGDVRGGQLLETTAAKEGFIATGNALLDEKREMDPPEKVPRAIFTSPQFAAVGYTEERFSAVAGACACRTLPMEVVPKAQVIGDTQGVIKMTIDPRNKRIVGVQIVSTQAADLIHEAALAVRYDMTIDDIIELVHVFPTHSEALKLAAQAFYRDVSKLSCCTQ
ncbi:MAG: mercury(II) reductase [Candidatus Geothermarchaeales archaeon]